ncbi:type II toxin-antitoxin system RelE/ParE family toxin [Pelagicoccus sp. SDUM812002]|uniref:type II toxin-antitoxin system RelE/ParE family toxin n=1 Tax=Pelagicoccus sp. SDUM812002 TaxID=3041266 RepID=UPI00280E20AE|nr:type II toxin-antitoxin system RelE/ParE family toxin [Pelagicoccus sp. SDUM812002]MDQ8188483.1 type II toxin-antitoxin system RelE/ParE family toxin [Pelagicoccus sp. SDUM812002]
MKLVWLKETEDDIERLFAFLYEKSPDAATKAIESILEKSEMLREFPELGPLMQDESGRRELIIPFGAGAYVLRYYILKDTVAIVRVWHSREVRK